MQLLSAKCCHFHLSQEEEQHDRCQRSRERPGSGLHVIHCIPAVNGGLAIVSSVQGSADNDPAVDTAPCFIQKHVCLSLPGLVRGFRSELMQQIAATHISSRAPGTLELV